MDGSLWPPRFEERREDSSRFNRSSSRGALIAVVTAGVVLGAVAALMVWIATFGPACAGMIVCGTNGIGIGIGLD
jgi:hypothetical protein